MKLRVTAFLSFLIAAPVLGQGVRLPSPGVVPLGEALVSELGCLNCHGAEGAAQERFAPKRAPLLDTVGARRTPQSIRALLGAPHEARPGTSMPDLLAGLPDAERDEAITDLIHFLTSNGGPLPAEPFQATDAMLEEGRQLLHEVGCVACHVPEESLEALYEEFEFGAEQEAADANDEADDRYVAPGTLDAPRVPFHDLASQTNVDSLAAFLMDPLAVRPAGRMPSLKLSATEARNIAVYLLREQGANSGYVNSPGLQYAYYEETFPDGVLDLAGRTPQRVGSLLGEFEDLEDLDNLVELKHREDFFAFEFQGTLLVEQAGTYTFQTESDDGSWIQVDGEQILENGGFHAVTLAEGSVELEAGAHSLRITYYEHGGGNELIVHWSGPGFELRPLRGDDLVYRTLPMAPLASTDFELDPQRVARGETRFAELGCASCHEAQTSTAPALSACEPDAPDGCLGSGTAAGAAHYAIDEQQRAALRGLLHDLGSLTSPTPAEHARSLVAQHRCYACHRRDDIGGPQPERADYFFADEDTDMGEERRIPPMLDAVGSKLQPEWLAQVLQEGASARPHMVTRMPQFGTEAMQRMQTALEAADRLETPPAAPPHSVEAMQAGRQLVGTDGFGCIQCHDFNGYRSLGIRAVDLAHVKQRIQYPWFRELLRDPAAMNMNARMPQYWVDGKSPVQDVLDGDIDAQIDAVWTYLGLGASMSLPAGLNVPDSAYELELQPGDAPRMVGVFMRGLSPRVVAVGNPEQVHYAFDLENSRLAKVWRGRFFNARGTWEGRAGELELPPTDEVHDLPAGPPFARLATLQTEWPVTTDRAPLLQARGRGFDEARRPVFHYALGEIEIEETPMASNEGERSLLLRRFRLRSPVPVTDLYFRTTGELRLVVFKPDPAGGHVAEFEERITW